MQLEAVGAISVGDLTLEVGGQVDDGDGIKGALLGADTATDTQALGDKCNLGGVVDFNAEFTGTDDGARFLALLTTFLDELVMIPVRGWQMDPIPSVCTVDQEDKVSAGLE
jgi:hypothetical protein